jgi:hypothetical protein
MCIPSRAEGSAGNPMGYPIHTSECILVHGSEWHDSKRPRRPDRDGAKPISAVLRCTSLAHIAAAESASVRPVGCAALLQLSDVEFENESVVSEARTPSLAGSEISLGSLRSSASAYQLFLNTRRRVSQPVKSPAGPLYWPRPPARLRHATTAARSVPRWALLASRNGGTLRLWTALCGS